MDHNQKYIELKRQYEFLTLNVVSNYNFPYPDEVNDEIWEKIYFKLLNKKFDPDHSGIASFMITMTHNFCKDQYQKNKIRKESFSQLVLSEVDIQETTIEDAAEIVFKRMKQLVKPFTFEILEMRYVLGMSFEEISKITGKTKTTLRVLIHRSIKTFEKDDMVKNIFQ